MSKKVINIYYGSPESETNTRVLSNLAERRFVYQGVAYGSVEHAYQVLKSGKFDKQTHKKYLAIGGFGRKIRGKGITPNFNNLELMEELVIASLKQNPSIAKKLYEYDDFTHTTNELIDMHFLVGLKRAKELLK